MIRILASQLDERFFSVDVSLSGVWYIMGNFNEKNFMKIYIFRKFC